MSAEKLIPDEDYLDEIIGERSLTMEDGRKRGATVQLEDGVEAIPQVFGPDDGDSLG